MQVKEALLHTIGQVTDLLHQMDASAYCKPLPEFEGSTLGQHFRHILEFFVCLERGVPKGVIDYASRERNLLFEEVPGTALSSFEAFSAVLAHLQPQTAG